MTPDPKFNPSLDPGLADYAERFDNAMQRAFKGIRTRKERRAAMIRSLQRRQRAEHADA